MSPRTSRPRTSLAVALALLLTAVVTAAMALAGVTAAPSAQAHAQLVSSTPADGSTVETMPGEVVFEFNEEINEEFAQIVFEGADGTSHSSTPVITGFKVTAPIPDQVEGPTVVARFRVVSADGHPIGGQTTFGVGQEPGPAPATGSTGNAADSTGDAETAASDGRSDQDGAPLLLVGGGVVVAVVLAAGVMLISRARRP